MNQWINRTNTRETCFRPSISQRKIFFMDIKPLHGEWRMVWFSSRDESPAGESRFRKVFPGDGHRLILQKFVAAIFQARILSLGLQILRVRSWWDNWWDADIGWQPGLQWLWIYHSLPLVKTIQEFHLVAVKRECTWHFYPNVCPVSKQGMLSLYCSLLALVLLGIMHKGYSGSQLSFGNEKALEIAEIEY